VVIGTWTTVVAALVMTTRASVKVSLAWSTSAQMGFMLVQCGVGAWHLALLHLVAHSLYKAHAFLAAGGTVVRWSAQSLGPKAERPSLVRVAATAAMVLATVGAAAYGVHAWLPGVAGDAPVLPLAFVLGASLVPLALRGAAGGARARVTALLQGLAVFGLTGAWHGAAALLFTVRDASSGMALRWGIVLAGLATLFVTQAVLHTRPEGSLARWLHPRLAAGLWLDELFTRATFRVWPPRLPPRTTVGAVPHVAGVLEAR
jgi:NAD(P)H-quinone oxidoreductase subunit 5